jgi:hypothetical protein
VLSRPEGIAHTARVSGLLTREAEIPYSFVTFQVLGESYRVGLILGYSEAKSGTARVARNTRHQAALPAADHNDIVSIFCLLSRK